LDDGDRWGCVTRLGFVLCERSAAYVNLDDFTECTASIFDWCLVAEAR
jgi:hypothetical protein